jgi:hypothetical protein
VLGLAHSAFPSDYGAMVNLAQLIAGGDGERPHEVLHVEPIGPARARALLHGKPDLILGNLGERLHRPLDSLIGSRKRST